MNDDPSSTDRDLPGDPVPDGRATPAGDELLRLDRQLCFALYAATNRITRLYRPLLDALGLTYPQYLTMLALWERSPRTVGDLGEALDLDSGTLTPLLKRMEAAGLVGRRRDPADERRVIVDLTAEGEGLRALARSVPVTMACHFSLPLDEVEGLRDRVNALLTRDKA